jgi:hypothetical protein
MMASSGPEAMANAVITLGEAKVREA